jgi:hypothetical protein
MMTNHFATLVGVAAAGAAIAAAPLDAAGTNQSSSNQLNQSCQSAGQSSTVCESPGDVEVKDAPPAITFYPYGSPPPTAG